MPHEIPPPASDRSTGGTRYADVEYARVMGYRPLRMDLVLPATASSPVPVVVWIHGGAWLFGSRLHGAVTEPACRALMDRGIAVALVEYRFSGEARFPACLHDIKAAVRWLRQYGASVGVNGEGIGVWGESAGGHLAAFIAMNGTDERLNGTVGVTGCSSKVAAGTDLAREFIVRLRARRRLWEHAVARQRGVQRRTKQLDSECIPDQAEAGSRL
jgi:acetyl esterase/lipase